MIENMSNTEIVNHTISYFQDRFRNGNFIDGWGSAVNSNDRCAIGSLIKETFTTKADFSRYILSKRYAFDGFLKSIMQINDSAYNWHKCAGFSAEKASNYILERLAMLIKDFKLNVQLPITLLPTQKPVVATASKSTIVIEETENV